MNKRETLQKNSGGYYEHKHQEALPKQGYNAFKGTIWEMSIKYLFYAKMKWLYTDIPKENDFGVDGYVEVLDEFGCPTGQALAVQCKSGDSYCKFIKDDENLYLEFNKVHFNYWKKHHLPIIIIMNFNDKGQYWAYFNEEKVKNIGSKKCRMIVPWENLIKENDNNFIRKFKQTLRKITDTHNKYQKKALLLFSSLDLLEELQQYKNSIATPCSALHISDYSILHIEFDIYEIHEDKQGYKRGTTSIYLRYNENANLEEHLKEIGAFNIIEEYELKEYNFFDQITFEDNPLNDKIIGLELNSIAEGFLKIQKFLHT
jgi:Domain of unknown function (DUF4365)